MISPSEPTRTESARTMLQGAQLELRRMRAEDVPEIMDIESVSFGRHHWSEESFYNEMNNNVGRYYSLLKQASGSEPPKLLGYCGFWLILDEAHITTVAVHPDYRGNAFGELMLVQTMERSYCSSIHWVTLEARVSNYNAQNLYYKYGFASVGLRPKYYQDNQEDALIMTTADIASEVYRARYKELKQALETRLNGFPKGFGQ
jgi:ribosomal-protein-alanine N-acetyltransferase